MSACRAVFELGRITTTHPCPGQLMQMRRRAIKTVCGPARPCSGNILHPLWDWGELITSVKFKETSQLVDDPGEIGWNWSHRGFPSCSIITKNPNYTQDRNIFMALIALSVSRHDAKSVLKRTRWTSKQLWPSLLNFLEQFHWPSWLACTERLTRPQTWSSSFIHNNHRKALLGQNTFNWQIFLERHKMIQLSQYGSGGWKIKKRVWHWHGWHGLTVKAFL